MDPETGAPTRQLAAATKSFCEQLGIEVSDVSQIAPVVPEAIDQAINAGINKANDRATSRASKVGVGLSSYYPVSYFILSLSFYIFHFNILSMYAFPSLVALGIPRFMNLLLWHCLRTFLQCVYKKSATYLLICKLFLFSRFRSIHYYQLIFQ